VELYVKEFVKLAVIGNKLPYLCLSCVANSYRPGDLALDTSGFKAMKGAASGVNLRLETDSSP
jgi:hypothetical protein